MSPFEWSAMLFGVAFVLLCIFTLFFDRRFWSALRRFFKGGVADWFFVGLFLPRWAKVITFLYGLWNKSFGPMACLNRRQKKLEKQAEAARLKTRQAETNTPVHELLAALWSLEMEPLKTDRRCYILNDVNGEYWRAPEMGTTKDIAEAHVYEEGEARKLINSDCQLLFIDNLPQTAVSTPHTHSETKEPEKTDAMADSVKMIEKHVDEYGKANPDKKTIIHHGKFYENPHYIKLETAWVDNPSSRLFFRRIVKSQTGVSKYYFPHCFEVLLFPPPKQNMIPDGLVIAEIGINSQVDATDWRRRAPWAYDNIWSTSGGQLQKLVAGLAQRILAGVRSDAKHSGGVFFIADINPGYSQGRPEVKVAWTDTSRQDDRFGPLGADDRVVSKITKWLQDPTTTIEFRYVQNAREGKHDANYAVWVVYEGDRDTRQGSAFQLAAVVLACGRREANVHHWAYYMNEQLKNVVKGAVEHVYRHAEDKIGGRVITVDSGECSYIQERIKQGRRSLHRGSSQ